MGAGHHLDRGAGLPILVTDVDEFACGAAIGVPEQDPFVFAFAVLQTPADSFADVLWSVVKRSGETLERDVVELMEAGDIADLSG